MLKANATKAYKWIALVLAVLMIYTPVLSIPSKVSAATATSYYVDGTIGNDSNDGMTIGAAFKTIQAAATVAQSGDTVYVRAGVYRETVTPANSGVTIKNYNSESVTVSGADLVTGWALDSTLGTGKNMYVADMNWNMYNGDGNIVFADGVLMKEATFPNIAVEDLLNSTKYNKVKTFTFGTTSSIVDAPGLGTTFPANTLTSGMLWVRTGNGYASYTAPITGNPTTSTININWPILSPGYNPDTTSYYYITRNKAVLDVETEWYKDVVNGKLYFIAPGNVDPSTIMVEAKKRNYAFDFSGKSNVTIDGIKLRGANLNFVNSSYNTVKNTLVDAPDYNLPAGMADLNGLTLGLNLNGDHNTIRDSEIRNLYGPGILVDGHDNNVINNYIHNVDFLHSYADAVKLNGYNHLVSHNTLTMSGRGLIGGKFSRSVIEYNDISYGMKLSKDGGAVYVVDVDMENTEFHHNVVHDIIGAGGSHGIYPDNSVHNVIFYDNITYNTSANGMLINVPNEYQLFYNNSVQGPIGQFCNNFDVCDSIGSNFTNNIVSGAFGSGANNNDMIKARNIISAGTTHWTAPYSGTNPNPTLPAAYTLKSTSTGFEQGGMISGVTDGYVGNRPEVGAVETGGVPWKVGHDFANPPNPTFYLNPNIPYKNQMKNAGFERGDGSFEEWTITSGTPSIFKQSAWDYKASSMVRFQSNAARLKAGDAIAQTITGLKPNTTYTLNAWGIIQGTVFQAVDYNDSSGIFSQTPFRGHNCLCGNTGGAWVKYNSIDFGTGLYNSINFGAVSRVTGGKIDVKVDNPTNPSIASYTINSANDVINNGAWNYNKTDTPITTSVTGVHDVYLVFSNANEIYLNNFRLSNTTANVDQAILGVKDFGGTEKTTTITDKTFNSTTKAKSVEFTTGPTNTSATIYASKPTGDYYAFVDGFGVVEKISVKYPTGYLFKDGLDDLFWENWTTGTGSAFGTPKVNTSTFLEGSGSYEVNEDKDAIYKVFPTSYNKTASLRFYDDMATAKTAVARVDGSAQAGLNNSWSSPNTMYGLGVMTGTSTANYSFKLGDVAWAASSIARSVGWHELKWDYSSGKGLVMYIDNNQVASTTAITGFNMIAMGDWTGDSKISTAFFDDVRITEWANDEMPRLTLPNNLSVGTSGPNAVVNFTVSAYDKKDGPLTVTTSVPSGSTFPIGLTTVNCSVTDNDNNTVTGSFIVEVKPEAYLENFENGLTGWVTSLGTATTSSVRTYDGNNSYVTDQETDAIMKTWSTGLPGKVISVWFYDENVTPAATNSTTNQVRSVIKVGQDAPGKLFAYMGIDTTNSTNKYIYRYLSNVVATTVSRSKGWHEFKFDFSNPATGGVLYIDGVNVLTLPSVNSWDVSQEGTVISFGDLWLDSKGNYPTYYDNLMISPIDKTAPTTQAVLDGAKGSSNWFTSDVTVTLQSQDDNAGVASTEYSLTVLQSVYGLQSTNGFVPYTSPLLLSDGIYELNYRSTDRKGNVEDSKTITVNVDKTVPTTVITVNGSPLVDGAAFLDSQLLTLLVQSEDQLSGLASQNILIDGVVASTEENILNWAGQLGIHLIQVVATDLAGNVKISEINVKVATDEASMQVLMERFVATGEVAGSLEAQITNNFSQSLHQLSIGHTDQAIKHMQDVLKKLEKTQHGEISDYVNQVLTTDANAIIAAWSR